MNRGAFLILPLLFLAFMISPPTGTFEAIAAATHVGLVCLADPSSTNAANPCPITPWTFNGPSPSPSLQISPSQIVIGVYVSNSDALNGFDFELKANSSILKPAGAGLSGGLFPSGSLSAICVGGVGSGCGPTDGPDVLHVFGTMAAGITNNPVSGLLFTATYNITGTTRTGGISIGFQNGCIHTSITGSSPPACLVVTDGTNTPLPETIQAGAVFDNSVQPNWVAVKSAKPLIVFARGGASGTVNITATAENGWPLLSADTVTFSAASVNGLLTSFNTLSCFTNGASCNVTLTVGATTGGTYSLTVYGSYVFTDPNTAITDTLIAPVTIQVNVQDFTVTLNPGGRIYMFGTFPLNATIQALGGYAGTVTVATQALNPATGIAFHYPASFSVGPYGVVSKIVNVTSSTFNLYSYTMRVSVVGSGCTPLCAVASITRITPVVTFDVSGFSLATGVPNTPIPGSPPALTVSIKSLGLTPINSFAGIVTLSSTSTPAGPTVSFSPVSLSLIAGSTGTSLATFTSPSSGVYTVHIISTGGANNLLTNQTAALFFNLTDSLSGVRSTVSGAFGLYHTSGMFGTSTFLSTVNATSGTTYSKTSNANILFNSQGTGHFIDEITTTPYWLSMNCGLDANLGSASCLLTRTLDPLHDGTVDISDYALVNGQFGQKTGSPGYNPTADLLATGNVNILDVSIEGLYFLSTVIP